ncbi:uncharacterized protein LOC110237834 [Exaiptasia diaphana]|uniref:Uncharacterized protein n=1 Tax=Exaiptasia diaphana TaxID=2652724 RepID=A0A913YJL2_EXADI|nr:uncharacterized protein LOC110237834 [Exaiptasia diaphana]
MYVELYGPNSQENDDNMPVRVHLKVRHESASYFKDGQGNIKEFRQKLGTTSWRKFEFDRFTITDTARCNEEKQKGNSGSLFCMGKNDERFQPMCCHFLSDTPCDDALLGAKECQSPFGTYTIDMPIDENAECGGSQIPDENCSTFDRSIYTHMNVWFYYLYWSDNYPTGPDDSRCRSQGSKRAQTRDFLKPKITVNV